jgi:cytochrome P450
MFAESSKRRASSIDLGLGLTNAAQVLRIHAPFWAPTPHYSTADFTYNGMFIPKDTVVLLNCWTIHHNEERYPDA